MLRKPIAVEAKPFSDFELTKVHYTKGHEGEPLVHATITYKGKAVGTLEDADYGGGYNWFFNNQEAEEVFNSKVEDGQNTYWNQLDFFYDLHRSAEAKKHLLKLKKDLKEGVECFQVLYSSYKVRYDNVMYTSVIGALTMDNVQKVLQNIDPEAYANANTIEVYELTPQGTIDVIEFKYDVSKQPKYRKVDVTLEYLEETDSSTKIEAYIQEGEHWNGYLMPIFKQDSLLDVLSLVKEAYVDNEKEGPAALHSDYATEHTNEAYTETSLVCHNGKPWHKFYRVDIDGDNRYFKMESGITWIEAK